MHKISANDEMRVKSVAAGQAIYRLSGISQFDPALRFELRKTAVEIIAAVAAFSFKRESGELDRLQKVVAEISEILEFATATNFIAPENAKLVTDAYDAVKNNAGCDEDFISPEVKSVSSEIKFAFGGTSFDLRPAKDSPLTHVKTVKYENGVRPVGSPEVFNIVKSPGDQWGLSERQLEILKFMAGKRKAQVAEIREFLGGTCSEKTLQRELWVLASSGFLRRHGHKRWTTYIYVGKHFNGVNSDVR